LYPTCSNMLSVLPSTKPKDLSSMMSYYLTSSRIPLMHYGHSSTRFRSWRSGCLKRNSIEVLLITCLVRKPSRGHSMRHHLVPIRELRRRRRRRPNNKHNRLRRMRTSQPTYLGSGRRATAYSPTNSYSSTASGV
jgi:hypothetical protein